LHFLKEILIMALMDTFESHVSPSGSGTFLPFLVGLLSLLIASIALYLHLKATPHNGIGLDQSFYEEKLDALEMRLEFLQAENESLKQHLNQVASQTQSAFTQVSREISALQSLKVSSAKMIAGEPKSHRPTVASAPVAHAPSASHQTHVIVSGDTLAKVARQYHVPLDHLIKANPNANPKNLRVGQVIRIPVA
jgi:LysM repeat protein